MDELVRDFPALELPVTLVCSSNRRKEQNMARQTLGFNWGPGAVSTSVWRGARLRDVLRRCGGVADGALYVCFEGAEDLPSGGGSRYGTSITRERALDPTMDVMLAYQQNGGPLLPDHGFPLRLIVPGCTAGCAGERRRQRAARASGGGSQASGAGELRGRAAGSDGNHRFLPNAK